MNVTTSSHNSQQVNKGFRVDVSRGTLNSRVSSEWFSRPEIEKNERNNRSASSSSEGAAPMECRRPREGCKCWCHDDTPLRIGRRSAVNYSSKPEA